MTDIELLPLPKWLLEGFTDPTIEMLCDYTRANVANATAAKDAEIEALRAEVAAVWNVMPRGTRYLDPPDGGDVPLHEQVRRMAADATRAERLAEALRGQRDWWLASKGEAVSIAPGGLTRIDPGFIALCDAHVQQIDIALRDHDQEGGNP